MEKYSVLFSTLAVHCDEIEADSIEEAYDIAWKMVENGIKYEQEDIYDFADAINVSLERIKNR